MYFDSERTFWFGFLLTVAEFILFRRRTRLWKIEYDAVGFELSQAERRLHPRRARYKRVVGLTLLWVPSAIAAFVLFFFPVATHLLHPSSRHLSHYRIPIPWTSTVLVFPSLDMVSALVNSSRAGRFGVTPFWDKEPLLSLMIFWAVNPIAAGSESTDTYARTRPEGATQVQSRDFRLSDVVLTCWQYQVSYHRIRQLLPLGTGSHWEVDCETPGYVNHLNFHATYLGRGDDMPAFYKIIENVTPVK